MAPSIAEEQTAQADVVVPIKAPPAATTEKPKIRRVIDREGGTTTASVLPPHYLPTWDHSEKYPRLQPLTHSDPGLRADPSFPDLLQPGTKIQKLAPTIGSEVTGVQLSSLSSAGKDQLALLVAQRKVVAFRDQDFADLPIADALEFGSHFGRHHINPTSGQPEGYPEIHLVHRYSSKGELDAFFADRSSTAAWHSDVTYEAQPSGTTFLYILEHLRGRRGHGVHGSAHSSRRSSAGQRGGVVRRKPVKNEHSLVRTHPVTGEKALFVNGGFTRSIVGLKKEENDALLGFLLNHVGRGIDYQARIKWAPKTVVVWDYRVTAHSAIVDWTTRERRHLARITPQAERPYETPYVPEQ
ncbi:hypothetical protein BDW68DRAFT_174660 [Aspergillus falconensis]